MLAPETIIKKPSSRTNSVCIQKLLFLNLSFFTNPVLATLQTLCYKIVIIMVNSYHILANNWEVILKNSINICIVFLCYLLEKYWEMCSFSENVARRLTQNFPEELVNYNKSFLSRIYPSGKRVDSSNYNPQEMWNCGCQMGKLFGRIILIAMIIKTNNDI